MIRGTWVQIPLGAITVFPQKLSSVEFPLTFSQFLLNLDCESICDPPGGDTLLVQGIYLTDYIYIYIYIYIYTRLISLLECHALWSIFGEHAVVTLQDT